jgi:L,D-peptidoglycan transpeptidase YkuD (ErfK/YbiS/YcfS/YnhG family)
MMQIRNWIVLLSALAIWLGGCAGGPPAADREFLEVVESVCGDDAGTSQVVVVLAQDGAAPERARFVTVAVYERGGSGGAFGRVLGPFAGVVGKNGFAPVGEKREGDRRTPTGRFTITELFGEDAEFRPRMPYRVVTEEDAWCEDPTSPLYNQWLHGEAAKAATDRLKRSDDLYRHAAVIDYNRWPVVPSAGSAIFMHKAEPGGAGTLGCVGLAAEELDAVLLRLDPSKRPVIVMGTPGELRRLRGK